MKKKKKRYKVGKKKSAAGALYGVRIGSPPKERKEPKPPPPVRPTMTQADFD